MTSVIARSVHESPSMQSQTSINAVLPVFFLAFFIQTSFWFIFLAISTSVSQVCKICIISHFNGYYSSMKSKSSFENESTSPFFSLISLSGIRVCSVYMSCIWSCYLRWIMSRHGYRYSSEQGSWSCFWWRISSLPRSLPILNTWLLIFMVTPVDFFRSLCNR